jgi:predicted amidohydrolase YtcJ
MEALFELDNSGELQVRVYGMVSASDTVLMRQWEERGPYTSESGMLVIRGVKAFYDGALGSRGAKLLEDYLDKPGHRGFSGEDYGFDEQILFDLAKAGFQLSIHAIGDAGNRETIDFFEKLYSIDPTTNALRHRIEHAQVIHPDDFSRLVNNKLIASMQPGHAAEDKTWAEERIGPDRIKGAYAWRTLRELEVPLIFGSDLIGSDHNIFYGLHSAITRRGKDLLPEGGWYIEEALTSEESLRAFTNWASYGAFMEKETGVLVKGKWGDVTVLDLDPLEIGSTDPSKLLDGSVLLTVINGKVIYQNNTLTAGNE